MMNKKYRDELVDIIKLVGQDLINRADDIVPAEDQMCTGYHIDIDVPCPMDGPPSITWSLTTICKEYFTHRLLGKKSLEGKDGRED